MSDVEDELLALAGGDVSSDDEGHDRSDVSASPPPKNAPSKGGAKKASKKNDDSEEEGEASDAPGSPDSQGSAAMDESDSDDDDAPPKSRGGGGVGGDDDMKKYPVDGLFISHAEKADIMRMREIEREQKIAERREEIERIRQNRMLRQLVTNQQDSSKKRKANTADLGDGDRKASRPRTKAGEASSKMDALHRAREERSNRNQQREAENDRRSRRRSPSYGRRSESRGSDRSSERSWAGGRTKRKSSTPEPKVSHEADIRDFERVRVGRSRFAEVCFHPGFEEAINGCFVRVNVGPDASRNNQPIYRMAMIKGFTQGRAYAMPNRQGKQLIVETYVKAAHGKATKEWPFISCSDAPFTEAEFNRYKVFCAEEGVAIPKRPFLINKIDDINKLVNHSWTEEEVTAKLARINDLKQKFSNHRRETLEKNLEQARAANNDEAVAKIQAELESLPTARLAFRTSLTPASQSTPNGTPRKDGVSQQERLAQINAENRRKNAEAVRQAQIKERAKMSSRPRQEGSADVGGTPRRRDGESPAVKADDSQQHLEKLKLLQQQSVSKTGVAVIHKPLMDDDIIGALDLDIDIDI